MRRRACGNVDIPIAAAHTVANAPRTPRGRSCVRMEQAKCLIPYVSLLPLGLVSAKDQVVRSTAERTECGQAGTARIYGRARATRAKCRELSSSQRRLKSGYLMEHQLHTALHGADVAIERSNLDGHFRISRPLNRFHHRPDTVARFRPADCAGFPPRFALSNFSCHRLHKYTAPDRPIIDMIHGHGFGADARNIVAARCGGVPANGTQ